MIHYLTNKKCFSKTIINPKIIAIELIIYFVFLSLSEVIIIIGIDNINAINDPSIHQTIPGRSIKQMIIETIKY
jgi:hypothetical protein